MILISDLRYPWLVSPSQEEYDMLVGLFYSFCTRAGILTRIEAQRLLRFMNYHEAVVRRPHASCHRGVFHLTNL